MYSLYSYGRMISDRIRMAAYETALRDAVKPDSIVMDVGTGTGIFAFLACKYGAQRVYAIEPSDVIELAEEIATKNAFRDRIVFIQDSSLNVNLNEKVNILISDIRGSLPFYETSVTSIIDARDRFLAADGIIIPAQDSLWCAWLNSDEVYRSFDVPWKHNDHGIDMAAGAKAVVNTFVNSSPDAEKLFLEPKLLSILDYYKVKHPDFAASCEWVASREGTIHGALIWFDCKTAEGTEFSNRPGNPESVYGRSFFPLTNPIEIIKGDSISFQVEARMTEGNYIWNWKTAVHGIHKNIRYQQSSFFAEHISQKTLHKMSSSFRPALNEDGETDFTILEMMSRGICLGDIAESISERNKKKYPTRQSALNKVAKMSQKYSI